MGDPKKHRKKYETPSHPWRGERIKEESGLVKEFGLKNKKEVWKASSFLRKFKKQTKMLITESGAQAEKEKKLMLEKLARLGLATSDIHLEDVLGLGTKDILERRLQTQVVRKNLANSMKQSRQFIVHGHVSIKGHKVTIPSYMVLREEEVSIVFNPLSSLASEDHPMRIKEKAEVKTQLKIEKKEENKAEIEEKVEGAKEE